MGLRNAQGVGVAGSDAMSGTVKRASRMVVRRRGMAGLRGVAVALQYRRRPGAATGRPLRRPASVSDGCKHRRSRFRLGRTAYRVTAAPTTSPPVREQPLKRGLLHRLGDLVGRPFRS